MKAKKPRIELLSVVALLADIPEAGLIRGEVGTVVEILGPDVYEVEFSGDDGVAYAELAVESANLIGLHNQGAEAVVRPAA